MQPARIDPACAGAAGPPAPGVCAHSPRVVGLGAPLSVRIRLGANEQAALRQQIITQSPASAGDTRTASADAPQAQAWREMLASLEPDSDVPLVVLWPTALATPALRGALTGSLAAIAGCPRGDADLAALADTLRTATSLLETLRALLAVDHGGLSEVDL